MDAWHAIESLLREALVGMADPWVASLVLVLTTLLLEDLAIAAGVALATQGTISWGLSLAAVAGGIAVGDLGLYALGVGATRVRWLRQRYIGQRSEWVCEQVNRRLSSVVLLARVIPGLRLLTYTACGFLRVPFAPFSVWVLLSVLLWTCTLYGLSVAVGAALAKQLGLPLPLAVTLPILALAAAVPLWRYIRRRIGQAASS